MKATMKLFSTCGLLSCLFGICVAAPARADSADLQTCLHGDDANTRIAACSRIIQSSDADANQRYQALTNRCADYNAAKRYPDALADCDAAIKLQPDDDAALVNRCWSHNDQGQYDAAIADCRAAIKLNPARAMSQLNLCSAYSGKHDWPKAIEACNATIKLAPDLGAGYADRCRALAQNGQQEQGLVGSPAFGPFPPHRPRRPLELGELPQVRLQVGHCHSA